MWALTHECIDTNSGHGHPDLDMYVATDSSLFRDGVVPPDFASSDKSGINKEVCAVYKSCDVTALKSIKPSYFNLCVTVNCLEQACVSCYS